MIGRLVDAARRGLTGTTAFTGPGAEDPRLRGRTYAIPFEAVWQASIGLVDGGLRGWSLSDQDDQEGVIRGLIRGNLRRFESAFTLRITLDQDAQTRVDGMASSRSRKADFGVNARRLKRFFRALDAALERRAATSTTA